MIDAREKNASLSLVQKKMRPEVDSSSVSMRSAKAYGGPGRTVEAARARHSYRGRAHQHDPSRATSWNLVASGFSSFLEAYAYVASWS